MATGIDPTVDYVFKRLFGDEDNALLLVDLLNAVIRFTAGYAVSGVYILNPFVEKDYLDGKVSLLDVRARDDPGRQFHLEMQQLVRPAFDKRLLYYWAGAHAGQLFKGDHYEMLHGTFTVCFLKEPLIPDAAWRRRFRVYDDEHNVLLCKDMEIHLLELSKFDLPDEEVKTPLERWMFFFKHGASLDPAHLPATLDFPVIRQAVEVLMRISQSEMERQRFLERQCAERDAASFAADFRAVEEKLRAAEEDARVARQEGKKGKLIGRVQLLQQLLARAETSSEELARRTEEDLLHLEESLKQQLSGTKDANGTPPGDKK